jgi:hypothetical protein
VAELQDKVQPRFKSCFATSVSCLNWLHGSSKEKFKHLQNTHLTKENITEYNPHLLKRVDNLRIVAGQNPAGADSAPVRVPWTIPPLRLLAQRPPAAALAPSILDRQPSALVAASPATNDTWLTPLLLDVFADGTGGRIAAAIRGMPGSKAPLILGSCIDTVYEMLPGWATAKEAAVEKEAGEAGSLDELRSWLTEPATTPEQMKAYFEQLRNVYLQLSCEFTNTIHFIFCGFTQARALPILYFFFKASIMLALFFFFCYDGSLKFFFFFFSVWGISTCIVPSGERRSA